MNLDRNDGNLLVAIENRRSGAGERGSGAERRLDETEVLTAT